MSTMEQLKMILSASQLQSILQGLHWLLGDWNAVAMPVPIEAAEGCVWELLAVRRILGTFLE